MSKHALVLAVFFFACAIVHGTSPTDEEKPKMAALGAESRNPTADEAKKYGLEKHLICINGQFIQAIEKDGPADKAELKAGDVILALDANKLYSRDDLADFLCVVKPGAKVEALVKRAVTFKEEKIPVTLGNGAGISGKGIVWKYAGIGQLQSASAVAKKEGKLILVGLSGADT